MHNEWNKNVREMFNKKLKLNGLKMKFVAEKLGFEYTTLSKWKNGHCNYGEDNLKRIVSFMGKL